MVRKNRRSIRKTRTIGKKRYTNLIRKKRTKKRMTKKEKQQLNHALFINYCSCIKSLKYNEKVKDYLEYPVCMSSIYTKRGFKPPKGVTVRCKKYKH